MPQVLIHYDESRHQSALRAVATGEAVFTKLLAYCQGFNLAQPLTTTDLPALLDKPAETLFDKYIAGTSFNSILGGLPLNRAKALELLEVPAEFHAFPQVVEQAKYELDSAAERQFGLVKFASSYEIKGTKVLFTAAARQKLEADCKSYATTDKQVAVLTELQTISAALNRLRTLRDDYAASIVFERGFIIPYGSDPGSVRPNPSFVQSALSRREIEIKMEEADPSFFAPSV